MNDIFMPRFQFRSYLLCVGLLLGGCALITACGKKGPLYLPDDAQPSKKTAEPAAAPPAVSPQK